jgi:hypothetical protein
MKTAATSSRAQVGRTKTRSICPIPNTSPVATKPTTRAPSRPAPV